MNPIYPRSHLIRRVVGVLGGLATLLASVSTGPAAFASQLRPDPPWWVTHRAPAGHLLPPPPGYFKHWPLPHPARGHASLTGGMPGWQIAVIALGAAILAATAIMLRRARWQPGGS